jgi:hypothetical protein
MLLLLAGLQQFHKGFFSVSVPDTARHPRRADGAGPCARSVDDPHLCKSVRSASRCAMTARSRICRKASPTMGGALILSAIAISNRLG